MNSSKLFLISVLILGMLQISWGNSQNPNSEVEMIDLPRRQYPTSIDNGFSIRRTATDNGMDPDAVEEVLRTQQPVVKTQSDGKGTTITTTYKLEPDGSISKHTRTQKRITYSEEPSRPTYGMITPSWGSNLGNPFGSSGYDRPYSFGDASPFAGSPSNDDPTSTSVESHMDEQGRLVKTTTYTQGNRQWKVTKIEYPPSAWPQYGHAASPHTPKTETTTIQQQLPSLDDFLKTQYASTTPKILGTIDVKDIPITAILKNGEEIPQIGKAHKVENIPQQEDTTPRSTTPLPPLPPLPPRPTVASNSSPSHFSSSKSGTLFPTPSTADNSNSASSDPLDMSNPDFWKISELEETTTPTSIPTTTAKSTSTSTSTVQSSYPHVSNYPLYPSYNRPAVQPTYYEAVTPRISIRQTPIELFLGKHDMTFSGLMARPGRQMVMRLVDEDGNVLTATFVLTVVQRPRVYGSYGGYGK